MKVMNSGIKNFIVILCLVYAAQAHSHQGKFVSFKGKLKSDSVFIELIGHEGFWNMSYFYTKNLKEYHLSGYYDSTHSAFVFSSEQDSVLIFSKKDEWKFKWWQEGKKMKNSFDSVIAVINDNSTYLQNRIARFQFKVVSENDSVQWLQEQLTALTFFRLKNNADSINLKLASMHQNMSLKALSCTVEEQIFHLESTLFKVNDLYLSFTTQISGACIQEEAYFNFSVETAEVLHAEDLFYFKEGVAPLYQSQEWFTYRYKVFSKQLIPYLKVEDTCLNDESLWQFPTWYMQGDSVVFMPFSAFVKENCSLDVRCFVNLAKLVD